jgi:hypothetical protein
MSTNMFAAFLTIAVTMMLGRMVTERSRRTLSPEQKLDLLERLSPLRKYGLVPLIAYILVVYKKPLSWSIWSFAAIIFTMYLSKWILIRRASVTDAYRIGITMETCIAFAGAVAFVIIAFCVPPGD